MRSFLEYERKHQAEFKLISDHFTAEARQDGLYRGIPRPFCMPISHAEENLFPGTREKAQNYFASNQIAWHQGADGKPSNHMCSSQVCCVNFLFPLAEHPDALSALLKPLFPTISQMLPMERNIPEQFVTFEWIGLENYLGEKTGRGGQRTRGANFTSADAAVMFDRKDGHREIVLIEWKYTESYSPVPLHISRSCTSRVKIYEPLYQRADCPVNKDLVGDFGNLFYEPFYQLMRQQMLAWQMETFKELGADVVSVLHISPAHNGDFPRVTSPGLKHLGDSATEVWQSLVCVPGCFRSVSTEDLFGAFPIVEFPELSGWWEYITSRYKWLTDNVANVKEGAA